MLLKFTNHLDPAAMRKILDYFVLCPNRIKCIHSEKHLKLKLFIYSYNIHKNIYTDLFSIGTKQIKNADEYKYVKILKKYRIY